MSRFEYTENWYDFYTDILIKLVDNPVKGSRDHDLVG